MSTTEQTLDITPNGNYNNLVIKTKYKWDQKAKQFVFDSNGDKVVTAQGVKPGHYVIVEKLVAEGTEHLSQQFKKKDGSPAVSYSCRVRYQDKDCSFFLPEFEGKAYNKVGGVNDKIKISCILENKLNKKLGVKVPTEVLKFEKV